MSRIRFLADHDLREGIIAGLLRREPIIHIVRVREVNLDQAPDEEILAYAAREELIVISHDLKPCLLKRMPASETAFPWRECL